MSHDELRARIVETARALESRGLTRGTSGNVSARVPEGYLVTPSGIPPGDMRPEEIVLLALDAEPAPGTRPSTEWRVHRDVLARRPEISAIVHAHPPFCTALACAGRSIPAFHYMVAVAGGEDIRCASYATFGSQELSDHVLAALEGRRACLMANHGMVATGPGLASALALAGEVEALAAQYHRVLQLGPPLLLDAAEMRRVLERFRAYGAGKG